MSQRPRLIFRADGSAQIGLGHVMRCLALADMLGNAYDRRFAIVQPTAEVVAIIEKAGINVLSLSSPDLDDFLTQVKSTDTLILDGYSFDRSYQLACRSAAWALVYIDDLCQPDPVANVVINHAGGINRSDYYGDKPVVHRESNLLLGPAYALLRTAFLDPDGFGDTPIDGPVLISLGGSDPQNTSATILKAIQQAGLHQPVRLIVGPLYPHRAALDTMVETMPHVQILTNLSARQMAEQLRACRLAIVSCSTVSYEVCAIGRPFIGIQTADNQVRLRAFFDAQSLAVTTLDSATRVEGLVSAIQRALSEPANMYAGRQRHFFDSRSPERFRELFTRLCFSIA